MKVDGLDNDRDSYLRVDKCIEFYEEIWFDLGKIMWKKYQCVLHDHVKYILNDIVKPSKS